MSRNRPKEERNLIVLAGPNGAGKSTSAPSLLRGTLGVSEFVNADTIAQGLSAFAPEGTAIEAGRIMLKRIRDLARHRASFAFETTLASRSFAPWIKELIQTGYSFHLVFLSLLNPSVAVRRVAERVRAGGHNVPEDTIRRRFDRGLFNFFALYRPLAETWRIYDNSGSTGPTLIARGGPGSTAKVFEAEAWQRITTKYGSQD